MSLLEGKHYDQLVCILEQNKADAERIRPLAKGSAAITKRLDQLAAADAAIMDALEKLPE